MILSLLAAACSPQYSSKRTPKVVNGEIDLTGWDFSKDGPVKLDGDWLFAWEKFIKSASWEKLQQQMLHTSQLPGYWHTITDPLDPSQTLPNTGYASYAVRITGLPAKVELAAEIEVPTAASKIVWLNENGEVLDETLVGKLSAQKQGELPQTNFSTRLTPYKQSSIPVKEAIILMHVSNHHYFKGGPHKSVQLGDYQKLKAATNNKGQLQDFMLGILFILGFYHILLYLQRRQDKSSIFFSLFCLSIALRLFSMGVAQRAALIDSVFLWEWFKKLEYISMPAIAISFTYYLYALVSKKFISFILRFTIICGVPLILFTLFSSPLVFPGHLWLFQLYVVLLIILVSTALGFYLFQGNKLAGLLLLSFFLLSIGVINDILHSNGVIQTLNLLPYTSILFLLLQAGIISQNNTRAHNKAEKLAVDLQAEMKERKDLQTSNEQLAEKQVKYNNLIEGLSEEYANAGKELYQAKKDQQRINKELKDAGNQLIQAEKLSGLGAMVSGIAHDINNPLNFIETARYQEQEKLDQLKTYLLQMIPEGEEGEEFKKDLLSHFEKLSKLNAQIKTGVNRVTEISKSMRNASRSETDKSLDVNLVELLEESILITSNKIKPYELIKNLPQEPPLVICTRSQVGQVLMNFLSNAADALTEYQEVQKGFKGVIQVDLAVNLEQVGQKEQKRVQISVSDNGAGIAPENRDKVLNAFYTTKAVGVGTGLGLAIASKIAQAHDGSIFIEDGLNNDQGGYGARFTLDFVG